MTQTEDQWRKDVAASIACWADRHVPGFLQGIRERTELTDPDLVNEFAVRVLMEMKVIAHCEDCGSLHNGIECPHCNGTCGCAGGHGH